MPFLDGAKARLDCVDFDLLLEGDLADVDLVANVRMDLLVTRTADWEWQTVTLVVMCLRASSRNRASLLVCSSFSAMSKAEREEEQWEYRISP